jgi:hypothetical protein
VGPQNSDVLSSRNEGLGIVSGVIARISSMRNSGSSVLTKDTQ